MYANVRFLDVSQLLQPHADRSLRYPFHSVILLTYLAPTAISLHLQEFVWARIEAITQSQVQRDGQMGRRIKAGMKPLSKLCINLQRSLFQRLLSLFP